MRTTATEGEIQKSIFEWLAAKKILAFRQNSGAMKGEHNGKKRFFRFGVPGMADIQAFEPHGPTLNFYPDWATAKAQIIYWIEVKDEKGKQTELQKSFQKQVEGYGHRYVLVRSLEDVKRLFE